MRNKAKLPDAVMVCSKVFAEWLLKQTNQSCSADIIWLDLILKYCNAAYDELIAEEMRKANQFHYQIKEEGNGFSILPSYDLVKMNANDPADKNHISSVTEFCDGYSVLTTGAAFPGKQQFPLEPSERWDLKYLIDECIYQGTKMAQIFEKDPLKCSSLSIGPSKRAKERSKILIWEDQYKYLEFIMANEYQFIDNQFPFCFGPSCPDRLLSMNTYHNIIRNASLDCAEICENRGMNKRYQEIFIVILARTILLYDSDFNKHLYKNTERMIALADKAYQEYMEKVPAGTDPDDHCMKIRAFLNTRVKAVMERPNKEIAAERFNIQNTAAVHRDTALDNYISPQEMFARTEQDQEFIELADWDEDDFV